jgi:hypothetical protein
MLPAVVDKQGGLLAQLSNFTGLGRFQFDPETYSVVMNCSDKKGVKSVCKQPRSSSSTLSGGREMLPETRKLIYYIFTFGKSVKYGPQNLAFPTPSFLLRLFESNSLMRNATFWAFNFLILRTVRDS